MSEERIIILEQHAKGTDTTLGRVENKIDTIVDALNSLVRIEERQSVISIRLNEGAKTMQNHESRIQAIETSLPGLIEKSNWLVMGVLGVIAIVGAAAAEVIFK